MTHQIINITVRATDAPITARALHKVGVDKARQAAEMTIENRLIEDNPALARLVVPAKEAMIAELKAEAISLHRVSRDLAGLTTLTETQVEEIWTQDLDEQIQDLERLPPTGLKIAV